MELISKKTEQIVVRRTQKEDFQKIHEFHKNRVLCPLPSYFKNALESSSAISLIAYVGTHLAGHVLVLPLSSQQNIEKKEALIVNDIQNKIYSEVGFCFSFKVQGTNIVKLRGRVFCYFCALYYSPKLV